MIDDGAFRDNRSITGISFEDGSKCSFIGKYAFAGCTQLAEVNLPAVEDGLTIDEEAFYECTNLTRLTFPKVGNEEYWYTFRGMAFANTGLTSLDLKCGNTKTSFNLGGWCFAMTPITNVVLPHEVWGASDPFYQCPIENITFSEQTEIAGSLFSQADLSDMNLVIPACVERIGSDRKLFQTAA